MSTKQQELLENLLKLAEKEQKKGNKSITQEKLDSLSEYVIKKKLGTKYSNYYPVPEKPAFSPLFNKFQVPQTQPVKRRKFVNATSFKNIERTIISILESIAAVLDNLHLFSKLPMFPESLLGFLKQTNKLWVLILVFLIRKTTSQLLNLLKKEKKVKIELNILNQNDKSLIDNSMFKKYEKVLKDLRFDKMMLIIELIGNFMDLLFNVIELYGVGVPDWFMSFLNFASMAMTIYRMNKDDEYVDDDITEELI